MVEKSLKIVKHKSFLITAMGRSGTMFLAKNMNRSRLWTVDHEKSRKVPEEFDKHDLSRFTQQYYGEVDSRMRWVFEHITGVTKGVIIRNPLDLWLSVYNKQIYLKQKRHHAAGRALVPGMFRSSLEKVDKAVQDGAITIRFEQMTTDPDYLQRVLYRFGIRDVTITEQMVQKPVNNNKKPAVPDISQIPEPYRSAGVAEGAWFKERYYGEYENTVPNPV